MPLPWLELNAVETTRPLSSLLNKLSLTGKHILLSTTKPYYSSIHPLFYGLSQYADKYFISVTTERVTDKFYKIYIVSSNSQVVEKALEILLKNKIKLDEVKDLTSDEIRELVDTKRYSLLDTYLKLSLRNYLYSRQYKPRTIGKKNLWFREGGNVLYTLDADLDPITYKGYISVDIRIQSSMPLWDKIVSENIDINKVWGFLNSFVIVPYGKMYAYGKIHGFIPVKVSEPLPSMPNQQSLLEYYKEKKGISLDPDEYPIVEVEILSPEPRGKRILPYPPSQVKVFLPIDKPDPHTRYEMINDVLVDIIKNFNFLGIGFRKAIITYKDRVNMLKDIKLEYGNRKTHISPLFSMQKLNTKPLHGPVNISKLLILLPRTVLGYEDNSKEIIEIIGKFIKLLYREYNFGEISEILTSYYDVFEAPDKQKVEFSDKLVKFLEDNSPAEVMFMPVINHSYLFKTAKQLSTDRYFHARIIEEETFTRIMDLIKEFDITDEETIKQYITIVKDNKIEDEQLEELISILSNIVFSLYVEFIIQREVYRHKVPNKLTWALLKPADGKGESIYMGYDVSRNISDRSEVAVSFILYDSHGYMLSAFSRKVHGEKISRDTLEAIMLSLLEPVKHRRNIRRLVIYKDGCIRGRDEYNDIMSIFNNIGRRIGLKQVDIIGIIKRHNLRLFAMKKSENTMINPWMGTWIRLWDINRYGVYAERALIISSTAKTGGTVKPVLLERYSKEASRKNIRDIVKEYLRLCRLDYWNPLDGINKLPIPVFMADKLAYLALQGVQIKTP